MDFTGEKIYKCGDSLSKIYKCGEVVWSASTPDYYLYLTVLRYILPYESETFEVEVFTNLPEVQAIIPVDWLSMVRREDNFYYFSTVINGSPEERNTTLTFTDTMGLGLSASCQVLQMGMPYDYLPLTFEAPTVGTKIVFNFPQAFTIQYSRDGNHWNTITDTRVEFALWSTNPDGTYTLPLMIKADNPTYCLSYPSVTTLSASTGPFIAYGNMMSLINSTNYSSLTSLTAGSAFRCFFKDCTGLTSVENLILPAISLSDNCYSELFRNCTSLTTPPVLPATTLAPYCYRSMFNGCTSLQTAPELPARTLAIYCYTWMFRDCPITKAPDLLATNRVNGAYSSMFYNCTNLNLVKCMLLSDSGTTIGNDWLYNVSPTGTFFKNPNSTWERSARGIPEGWTVIDW